ncbi:MAG: ATPase [Firmicutes bacterium HGW-Firmicutes-7]|nr:MAG: ATPase [Firmicutes bacterium HGW-Firmicutes-7]
MYIERNLESVVLKASNNFPVILITGPRQVGKTTMLERIAEDGRNYVTLDQPMVRELAINDPELFLQRYQPPVIIDEIQYAPELLPYIKIYVDQHKTKGDFWLIGSQMFHPMKNVSESLAGRVGIINMLGLSNSELMGGTKTSFTTDKTALFKRLNTAKPQNLKEVYERIYKGSMPALYDAEQNIEQYYSSYVNTYLQRDVKNLTQVGDEMAFLRFLSTCAARTSQMVNYADMAKDVGISPPTAKQWLSILVSSGIITLVEPYFNNALKRIIKSPNMYFLDTGLCAYLTRWTSAQSLEVGAMSGAFFETYVVGEIVKSYYHAGKRPPIFYYRDTDNKEIDLIIEQNNILYPIEIKKSSHPKKDAIKHFKLLEKTGKQIGPGNVICLSSDLIPIDQNNYCVPVWLI